MKRILYRFLFHGQAFPSKLFNAFESVSLIFHGCLFSSTMIPILATFEHFHLIALVQLPMPFL
jgi:hypothetical protein